jgi:hypothetical protein
MYRVYKQAGLLQLFFRYFGRPPDPAKPAKPEPSIYFEEAAKPVVRWEEKPRLPRFDPES